MDNKLKDKIDLNKLSDAVNIASNNFLEEHHRRIALANAEYEERLAKKRLENTYEEINNNNKLMFIGATVLDISEHEIILITRNNKVTKIMPNDYYCLEFKEVKKIT